MNGLDPNIMLAMQLARGMSDDFLSGNPIGFNTNAAVGQVGQTAMFMKMMKDALGPNANKMAMGSKGLTFTVAPGTDMYNMLMGDIQDSVMEGPFKGLSKGWNPNKGIGGVQNIAANPFEYNQEDGIDVASAAFLTPENVATVAGLKHQQEQLKQQSYRDIVDSMYKGEQLRMSREASAVDIPYKKALTAQAEAKAKAETPSIDVEGVPFKMTPSDFLAYQKMTKEDKSAAIKNYEYAQTKEGGGFTGSFMAFQDAAKTTHQKDYEAAVASGYKGSFNNWLGWRLKQGATTINIAGAVEKEKALSGLKGQTYFNDPKWVDDVNKYIGSEDVQNKLFTSKEPAKTRSIEIVNYIEDKIKAGKGEVVKKLSKGGLTTWTVRWPSGDTEDIKARTGESDSGRSKEAVMSALRKANPGVSDDELESYAKKKGYF